MMAEADQKRAASAYGQSNQTGGPRRNLVVYNQGKESGPPG